MSQKLIVLLYSAASVQLNELVLIWGRIRTIGNDIKKAAGLFFWHGGGAVKGVKYDVKGYNDLIRARLTSYENLIRSIFGDPSKTLIIPDALHWRHTGDWRSFKLWAFYLVLVQTIPPSASIDIITIFVNLRLSLVLNDGPQQPGLMLGSSYLNHLDMSS